MNTGTTYFGQFHKDKFNGKGNIKYNQFDNYDG